MTHPFLPPEYSHSHDTQGTSGAWADYNMEAYKRHAPWWCSDNYAKRATTYARVRDLYDSGMKAFSAFHMPTL